MGGTDGRGNKAKDTQSAPQLRFMVGSWSVPQTTPQYLTRNFWVDAAQGRRCYAALSPRAEQTLHEKSKAVPRSPSAVSEARFDGRMMCGQAAPARFRYSDLKEAARRRTRALWGLNGMEGWCVSASSCCRGARKTTAGALEFSETEDDRGIRTGEAGKNRFVEAQGTLRLRAPGHAQMA